MKYLLRTILILAIGNIVHAQVGPWDMKALSVVPKVYENHERDVNNIKAIFYDGLAWKGKPTRVFAYYGIPKVPNGKKVPALVLIHGGGGTAFAYWVQLWVDRGYAAIAMDTCGCVSDGPNEHHLRHEYGGPAGWDNSFNQLDEPIEDQWTYHAIADAVLAHSLIRSFEQVDANKIGVTGISWGGYLTCIVAAVDGRFKFAAPVYGCGFLGDDSRWSDRLKDAKMKKWLKLWDPSMYLGDVKMPMLWVTGTNDFAYPMDSLQKSYRLPKSERTICMTVRMPHGHGGPGENPKEIYGTAEAFLNNAVPLAQITKMGRKDSDAWVSFESKARIIKAELNYTTDIGEWKNRNWQTIPAIIDEKNKKVSSTLLKETKVYYFNLTDERGDVVSSEHEELSTTSK